MNELVKLLNVRVFAIVVTSVALMLASVSCKSEAQKRLELEALARQQSAKKEKEFRDRETIERRTLLSRMDGVGDRGMEYSADFSYDSHWLVTAHSFSGVRGSYGRVVLWDIQRGKKDREWLTSPYFDDDPDRLEEPIDVSFVENSSNEILVAVSETDTIKFDVQYANRTLPHSKRNSSPAKDSRDTNGSFYDTLRNFRRLNDSLGTASTSSDWTKWALINTNKQTILCDLPCDANNNCGYPTGFVSNDAKLILACFCRGAMMKLISIDSCVIVREIEGTFWANWGTGPVFSPSGLSVVLLDDSTRGARLHDIESGRLIQYFGQEHPYGEPLAFSHDGLILALISNEEITLWTR